MKPVTMMGRQELIDEIDRLGAERDLLARALGEAKIRLEQIAVAATAPSPELEAALVAAGR